tara:strand:- start:1451 stop:1786 length:336 start_codon:yes stop_codon:yes gene_type:complete
MIKNSILQNILISRIDQFCGIEMLTKKLTFRKSTLKVRDRMMFDSMIQYNKNLYLNPVPCENDFIVYKASSLKALDLLESQIKLNNCKYLSFIHSNILFGVTYTKDIRLLA